MIISDTPANRSPIAWVLRAPRRSDRLQRQESSDSWGETPTNGAPSWRSYYHRWWSWRRSKHGLDADLNDADDCGLQPILEAYDTQTNCWLHFHSFITIIIPLFYLCPCCYSYCNASLLCSANITRYFYYWHTFSICMSTQMFFLSSRILITPLGDILHYFLRIQNIMQLFLFP